jgi:hypothetical protein
MSIHAQEKNTFNENSPEEVASFVASSLAHHTHFTLGTADQNGAPHVVGIGLTYDDNVNVIWKSKVDTVHTQHIHQNQRVAVCLATTHLVGEFGFYAHGTAREVTDTTELEKCIDLRYRKRGRNIPPLESLLGDALYRMYIAELTDAWVTDDRHQKFPVNLAVLRRQLQSSL